MTGTHLAEQSMPASTTATCEPQAHSTASALLQERFDGIEHELEIHIEDCQWQYLTAYERYLLHGNPHDRDEALLHLHRMNTAILSRSAAVQAARHAQFERRVHGGHADA